MSDIGILLDQATDTGSLKRQLSEIKDMAKERVSLLEGIEAHWQQLERYEQWANAKLNELKTVENLQLEYLSSMISEFRVTFLLLHNVSLSIIPMWLLFCFAYITRHKYMLMLSVYCHLTLHLDAIFSLHDNRSIVFSSRLLPIVRY